MPLTYSDRWAVVTFKRYGFKHNKIRQMMSQNIKDDTISRWYQTWLQTGDVIDAKRQGRKRSTTEEQDDKVISHMSGSRDVGITQVQKKMKADNISISSSTIYRRLKERGAFYGYQSSKPLISEKNRKHRLDWAKRSQNFNWDKVIFSDEKVFVLGKDDGKCWILPGEDNNRYTKKGKSSIHIWGAITKHKLSKLHKIEGSLNQHGYKKILEVTFMPLWHHVTYEGRWYFQQDGAAPHRGSKVMEFLNKKKVDVLEWPAQSPDLNPIENLWSILQKRVKERRPQSKSELISVVYSEWANIDGETLQNLYDSMPNRIEQVIQNNGYQTDY